MLTAVKIAWMCGSFAESQEQANWIENHVIDKEGRLQEAIMKGYFGSACFWPRRREGSLFC